jgi:hypothetical protein
MNLYFLIMDNSASVLPSLFKVSLVGRGCDSIVECLPATLEALDLVPNTMLPSPFPPLCKKKKKKGNLNP